MKIKKAEGSKLHKFIYDDYGFRKFLYDADLSPQAVYGWFKGISFPSAKLCSKIVRLSKGSLDYNDLFEVYKLFNK